MRMASGAQGRRKTRSRCVSMVPPAGTKHHATPTRAYSRSQPTRAGSRCGLHQTKGTNGLQAVWIMHDGAAFFSAWSTHRPHARPFFSRSVTAGVRSITTMPARQRQAAPTINFLIMSLRPSYILSPSAIANSPATNQFVPDHQVRHCLLNLTAHTLHGVTDAWRARQATPFIRRHEGAGRSDRAL